MLHYTAYQGLATSFSFGSVLVYNRHSEQVVSLHTACMCSCVRHLVFHLAAISFESFVNSIVNHIEEGQYTIPPYCCLLH